MKAWPLAPSRSTPPAMVRTRLAGSEAPTVALAVSEGKVPSGVPAPSMPWQVAQAPLIEDRAVGGGGIGEVGLHRAVAGLVGGDGDRPRLGPAIGRLRQARVGDRRHGLEVGGDGAEVVVGEVAERMLDRLRHRPGGDALAGDVAVAEEGDDLVRAPAADAGDRVGGDVGRDPAADRAAAEEARALLAHAAGSAGCGRCCNGRASRPGTGRAGPRSLAPACGVKPWPP